MAIPDANKINFMVHVYGIATDGGAGVKPAQNLFTFRRTSTSPAINKSALNTAFQTAIMTPLKAAMNVRYTPGSLTIRCLDDFNDVEQAFAVAGTGAIATDSLPTDGCVSMLLRTALRGRNYRGAKRFGPASEADTTDDILTGGGLANWEAVRDALKADFIDADGNTWRNTVVSRNLSVFTLLPIATVSAQDVTDCLLNLNIGTMRRRRGRTVR